MAQAQTTTSEQDQKGRTVGVWLNPGELKALGAARGGASEGTWCKATVLERLRREGFIGNCGDDDVAAQAVELARIAGKDRVKAKLGELAAEVAEVHG